MAELTSDQRAILKKHSVEEITQAYQNQEITHGRYSAALRAKAQMRLEDMDINNVQDYLGGFWKEMVKEGQEGWDYIVEAATRDTSKDTPVLSDIWNGLKASWGIAKIIFAPLNAISNMDGELAKRLALHAGASPGWAAMIGFAANAGTAAIGQGAVVKFGAKGVQALSKAGWLGSTLKSIATPRPTQLELPLHQMEQIVGDVIKPGMTKEAIMQATLEKLQAGGKEIDAAAKKWVGEHVDDWLRMGESQMELPLQALKGGLEAESVKLNALLEKMLNVPTQLKAGASVSLLHDPARKGILTGVEKTNSAGTKYLQIKEAHGGTTGYINSFIPEDQLVADVAKVGAAATNFVLDVAHATKGITIDEAKKKIPGLAARLGIDLDKLKNITPGGMLDPKNMWYENPKKMYGYLTALEPHMAQINSLAKAAVEGGEAAQAAFARYMTQLFTADPEGKVRYTQGFTNMLAHWAPDAVAAGDIPAALRQFAWDMSNVNPKTMGDITSTLQAGFNPTQLASVWPKLRELYMNALLPFAWTSAAVGNTWATGMAVAERAAGAIYGTSQHGYQLREPLYMLKGMSLALGDAFKAYGRTFIQPQASLGRFSYAQQFTGATGQVINAPLNAVKGMDNFFNLIITRGSYYATALREATLASYSGRALGIEVLKRVQNPNAAMIKEADVLAKTATYQNQLNGFWSRVQSTLQYGPIVLMFPFMKSAINLGIYGWNRTPILNLVSKQLYKDIAGGGAAADAAIGRLVMAQAMGMFYYELAKDGYVTGYGPIDPALRRTWLVNHVPYSVRTRTGWIPISNHEPANTPLGMIADFVQIVDKLDEPTATQYALAISFAIMHNFASNTFWNGTEKLIDTLSELQAGKGLSEKSIKEIFSPSTGFMTLTGRAAQAVDPLTRDVRTFGNFVQSKVPFYSKDVPVARDSFGDPIAPPASFGGSWFSMLRPIVPAWKPYETDPLKLEYSKYQAKTPYLGTDLKGKAPNETSLIPERPTDMSGIELTPEEQAKRIDMYRKMIRHPEIGIENMVINNPDTGYQQANDNGKRVMLERAIDQHWRNSGDALIGTDPVVAQRWFNKKAGTILPRLNEPERSEQAANFAEGLQNLLDMQPEVQANLEKFGIIGQAPPETVTYSTPYGPLTNIREVPRGTPGAIPESQAPGNDRRPNVEVTPK